MNKGECHQQLYKRLFLVRRETNARIQAILTAKWATFYSNLKYILRTYIHTESCNLKCNFSHTPTHPHTPTHTHIYIYDVIQKWYNLVSCSRTGGGTQNSIDLGKVGNDEPCIDNYCMAFTNTIVRWRGIVFQRRVFVLLQAQELSGFKRLCVTNQNVKEDERDCA
jgi:hypothetical protein